MYDVGGKPAFAIVLKPSGLATDVGAGGCVDVAIAVDVADLQACLLYTSDAADE